MAVSRIWYIIFYVLYMVMLSITLWVLLYYSGVPTWVWILYVSAMVIFVIGLIIKETLMTRVVTASGLPVKTGNDFWSIFYYIAHIVAFILIVVGLAFNIIYAETVPWWVWLMLGISILLSVLSTMILAIAPGATAVSLFVYVLSFITYIIALVLLIIYSTAPWWVWLMIGATLILSIIAGIFENMSVPNIKVIPDNVVPNYTTTIPQCGAPPNYGTMSDVQNITPQQYQDLVNRGVITASTPVIDARTTNNVSIPSSNTQVITQGQYNQLVRNGTIVPEVTPVVDGRNLPSAKVTSNQTVQTPQGPVNVQTTQDVPLTLSQPQILKPQTPQVIQQVPLQAAPQVVQQITPQVVQQIPVQTVQVPIKPSQLVQQQLPVQQVVIPASTPSSDLCYVNTPTGQIPVRRTPTGYVPI